MLSGQQQVITAIRRDQNDEKAANTRSGRHLDEIRRAYLDRYNRRAHSLRLRLARIPAATSAAANWWGPGAADSGRLLRRE